jgi:hypothetical protein
MTPKNPIPIEATPVARRDNWSLEAGNATAISPKTKIATPVITSETHEIVKRRRSLFIMRGELLADLATLIR